MPEEIIPLASHPGFFLRLMREEDVDAVKRLSDSSVGKDLYLREELLSLIGGENYFYLLYSPEGEFAGYLYFYLTDSLEAERTAKLPKGSLEQLCPGKVPLGNIQSIALVPSFRNMGLSTELIRFASESLSRLGARLAFVICWKAGENVPLGMTMQAAGFRFLAETENVWYNNLNLICPICKGRCRCSAAVYYCILNKENRHET